MPVSSTILPIRPPLNPRPSSTSSLLKRRHDFSFDSADYLEPPSIPKRRRTPVQQLGANAIMDLSLLGPPLFESSNPRFANLGTPDKEWPMNNRPSPLSRSSAGFSSDSTPIDSPARMTEEPQDMDMMDCDQEAVVTNEAPGRVEASLKREASDIDMTEERPASQNAADAGKGKLCIVMGFRADCERCQRREPGHISHFVRKP